jgi:DNA modification methylase
MNTTYAQQSISNANSENRQKKIFDKIWFFSRLLTEDLMDELTINLDLNRRLVSFQGNKSTNGHRWYNYREGFSSELVKYCIEKLEMQGPILDPFAGSGTTLFTASKMGIESLGIDLLPNSIETIEVRKIISTCDRKKLVNELKLFIKGRSWGASGPTIPLNIIPITQFAYPNVTKEKLERYLFEVSLLENNEVKKTLTFAAMCILEQISYTRKDGQYLRWDSRSERQLKNRNFTKSKIFEFEEALVFKIDEIIKDVESEKPHLSSPITLLPGSCLNVMPSLEPCSIGGIITSPPYCNRYDYTRTYALELAFLGTSEDELKELRQLMLSCTVENREKKNINITLSQESFAKGLDAFSNQELLREIIAYLDLSREQKLLNNAGIVRMVRNYFLEMALVISDCFRVLKPNAPFVMVNDNVQYQGISIPVDLILSNIAKKVGFVVEKIWILPTGKGNSSQQMGKYGRRELRKCIYHWRKPE